MSEKLEDVKRAAIAAKLADMRAIQHLLIDNDKALIIDCPDRGISNRLEVLLQDDQMNLEIIDTVITQYGIKAEPRFAVVIMIEHARKLMTSSLCSFFEKVAEHELIKHSQAIAGVLIYKAAQIVGTDVAIAIAPLNKVNFDNRNHQEQLKRIMEILSTVEITGQAADQSLWAKVQDAIGLL
ncbi:MAG: hypothetical protein DCF20_17025 [Pseudanabaena sp.]|nr:MAG: hypothetical protein DCF20_17025 [Pseudanabaena sp.]